MQRTPTTYTYQDIDQWNADVRELPKKINECEIKIAGFRDEIARLEANKDEVITRDINPQAARTKVIYSKLAILQNPLTIAHNAEQIRQFEAALSSQRNAQLELERRVQTLEATIVNYEITEDLVRYQQENLSLFGRVYALPQERQMHMQKMTAASIQAESLRGELKLALQQLAQLNSVSHTHHTSSYSSTQSGAGTHSSSNPHLQETSRLNQTIQRLNAQISACDQDARHHNSHIIDIDAQKNKTERQIQENVAIIAKLEAKLAFANFKIPNSVSDIQFILSRERGALADLQKKLGSLRREMENNATQQRGLESESARLTREKIESEAILAQFIESNPNGELQKELSGDKYRQENLDLLKAFYHEESKILLKYRTTQRSIESNIDQNNSSIRAQLKLRDEHDRKLRERYANQFLSDFNCDDEKIVVMKLKNLLNTLNGELSKALTQYAESHIRIDDPMVRARLREYSSRTAFIVNDDRSAEAPENLRRRLIHLSGYIWSMQENITDKEFLLILSNVLENRAIAKKDALPEFESLRGLYPAQLHALTPENLQALEAQEYSDAYKNLNDLLNNQPTDLPYYARQLFSTGKCLLNAVNDNNNSYSHSTQILTAAHALILDFKNPQNHQRLANLLRENQHGRRSTAKVVAGWVMMLLAAASLAVFITLGFLSLGILSAPVALGMTASTILFGAGLALCINGRNKGVHKAIMNLQWAADKSNEKYAESPLSKHSYFKPPTSTQPEASAPPLLVK